MPIYKSPLEQAKAQLYPKPELNRDFYQNAHKDGYFLKGNEARLGKGRLNALIDEYGVWNDKLDYAKGFLAYVDPREFLNGTMIDKEKSGNYTLGDKSLQEEIDNPDPLDLARMNNEGQTPFLNIDFDKNEITGHEGRHRLSSLAKAGITRVPIVIRDSSLGYNKQNSQKRNYKGFVNGQNFGLKRIAKGMNFDSDLIPLNYKNIEDLYKIFGE